MLPCRLSPRCQWLSLAVLACALASTIWLLVDRSSGSGSAKSVPEATPRSGTHGPDPDSHTYANDGQLDLDDGDDDDDVLILCKHVLGVASEDARTN